MCIVGWHPACCGAPHRAVDEHAAVVGAARHQVVVLPQEGGLLDVGGAVAVPNVALQQAPPAGGVPKWRRRHRTSAATHAISHLKARRSCCSTRVNSCKPRNITLSRSMPAPLIVWGCSVPLPACFQLPVDLCCDRVIASYTGFSVQCSVRLRSCFTVLRRRRAAGGLAAVDAGFTWRV